MLLIAFDRTPRKRVSGRKLGGSDGRYVVQLHLLIVDSTLLLVVGIRLLEVSDTLKLSEEAKGAISDLCLLLADAAASASSLDRTFSKMLLKRPFFTSAVVSPKDFLGKVSDIMADGVEYSNGGSANGTWSRKCTYHPSADYQLIILT